MDVLSQHKSRMAITYLTSLTLISPSSPKTMAWIYSGTVALALSSTKVHTCACYVLAVTDVSTCYHWTIPLRLKSDSTGKLCLIILSMPENPCPSTLCTDGGGKFFNTSLNLEQEILHPPAPYTSEYSSLSEQNLCTLMALVRCCLIDAGLPDKNWAETCAHTTYLINVTCHEQVEMLMWEPPDGALLYSACSRCRHCQ